MSKSHAELRAAGRAARKTVARSSLARWEVPPNRADPVSILQAQNATRVPELIGLRHQRMLANPFTLYRGGAAIMAADLASVPNTGITAQLSGDAHLANFGAYASAERDMVFDLNDFDESLPGPFEWDLKRLTTSFAVAGRYRKFSAKQREAMVRAVAQSYRETVHTFAGMSRMDIWYAHLDIDALLRDWSNQAGKEARRDLEAVVKAAKERTSAAAVAKYTTQSDGHVVFKSEPPELVPVEELLQPSQFTAMHEAIRATFDSYDSSLAADRLHLISGYRVNAVARKVVGVGSVGTRCWAVLLTVADDEHDPLMLQLKEAGPSVLEGHLPRSRYRHSGRRVVEGQRLIQTTSDVLLGWASGVGSGGEPRQYYVRQMWDWKSGADLDGMSAATYVAYARMCGWAIARAHARSGHPMEIASYLGSNDKVDSALVEFAERYADQNEADYVRVKQAAQDGEIPLAK